jgi:hypothetical protein
MTVKKNGEYDGRTSPGRQSVGKPNKEKATNNSMEKGLKNTKKSGK